jgi:dihydroxyacetone kinase
MRTTTSFHEKKIANNPSVTHGLEITGFNSAKSAVDKDLSRLLGSKPLAGSDLVYSVHCSDVNGLSSLENNILAHEISEFLGTYNNNPSYLCRPIDPIQQTSN